MQKVSDFVCGGGSDAIASEVGGGRIQHIHDVTSSIGKSTLEVNQEATVTATKSTAVVVLAVEGGGNIVHLLGPNRGGKRQRRSSLLLSLLSQSTSGIRYPPT